MRDLSKKISLQKAFRSAFARLGLPPIVITDHSKITRLKIKDAGVIEIKPSSIQQSIQPVDGVTITKPEIILNHIRNSYLVGSEKSYIYPESLLSKTQN